MELGLWLLAAFITVHGVASGAMRKVQSKVRVEQPSMPTAKRATTNDEQLTVLSDSIIENDPFRLARQPTDVPFESSPGGLPSAPSPPSAQPPQFVLAGLVGGPPWEALLEGIPNREGAVLARLGDQVAGFRLVRVDHRGVTLRGSDTTMILSVRRAGR